MLESINSNNAAFYGTTGSNEGPGTAESNGTFISRLADKFENAQIKGDDGKEVSLIQNLNDKIDALAKDSSDPAALARYQKAIMVYTVHQNSQSSLIKSIADLDKGIIHNFS